MPDAFSRASATSALEQGVAETIDNCGGVEGAHLAFSRGDRMAGASRELSGVRRSGATQLSSAAKRARAKWDSISARMAVPSWIAAASAPARGSWRRGCDESRLLFIEQANQLVVLLDGLERLDEDGLPGGGGAVDDAGNLAFELGLDRDDEAVAADGDELVLGAAVVAQAAQRASQALLDGAVLAVDRAPDAAELRRGVIGERAVGLDLAAQLTQQRGEIVVEQRCGKVCDPGAEVWRVCAAPADGKIRSRHAATRSTTVSSARISSGSSAEPSMRALSSRSVGSKRP